MAHGKHNKHDSSRGAGGPSTPRGSSNRGGRGFIERGRGRGGFPPSRGRGRGGYLPSNDTDFILQIWDQNGPGHNSYDSPRGRGRGRAGGIGSTPERNVAPFRGVTRGSPTKRGRGGRGGYDSPRGGFNPKSANPNTPLSMLLRPLLRPVKFVPATQHRFLFQAEEELIQPIVETAGNEEHSHVPTADRVARMFSGSFKAPETNLDISNENTEGLEEIDFADVGKFQEEVNLIASNSTTLGSGKGQYEERAAEEAFTGRIKRPVPEHHVPEDINIPAIDEQLHGVAQHKIAGGLIVPTMIESSVPDVESDIAEVSSTIQSILIQEDMEVAPTFFVDAEPSNDHNDEPPVSDPHPGPELGLTVPDDGDVVVYVAPLPRQGRSRAHTPLPEPIEPAKIRTTSVLTGLPIGMSAPTAAPAPVVNSISFSFNASSGAAPANGGAGTNTVEKPPMFTSSKLTPAKLKSRQRGQWAVKQRQRKAFALSSFASRGADVSEAQLTNWKRDPKINERRHGDSDVEWGDDDDDDWEDDEDDVEVRVSVNGLLDVTNSVRTRPVEGFGVAEGMDVDPELELEVDAMRRFAEGMGPSGSRHVTIDDVEDERRIREEDEDEDAGPTSDDETDEDEELEGIMKFKERVLIAESDEDGILEAGEEDEEFSDDDDDQSPKSNFQARLERLRQGSKISGKDKDKGKGKAVYMDSDSEVNEEDQWNRNQSWADEDDDFIAHIHDILDENAGMPDGRDKKVNKTAFRAIYNGDFEDEDMWKPARKARDKSNNLPSDLVELWKRDRAKKAAYKQERELARLTAAADPFTEKKGGKKGKKAMLAAARLDPTITVLPNRVIDFTTLVQQIHRFISNLDGPNTMSLPPANKQTRKDVHELATAFGLKSQSKGKGDARYTTLIKTTMTGISMSQKKVAKIVRRAGGGGGSFGGSDVWKKSAEKSQTRNGMPRHKEGDEVGKAAPKINETNVGFKMLASMGWAEGDTIGLSGGLQNPLTAVMKTTKLGLGATK
ncbi:hypothetical protein D9757_007991 [Collybiopsis confluens]|uniref:Protein SQS1 n=1 Tax=Collybiopsis confluens TaxID=2823264 RepID=A0A8H5M122_9AGAR|nr:hypothetical protein D9757_007991 [Collybiopsis confluens]